MQALLIPILCMSQLNSTAGPVTVKDLLKEVSRQAGVELHAEGEVARMLVVTAFEDVTVESFKRALATVVDAEWDGFTLSRPKRISDEYWAHIEEGRRRNTEDLRAFIRCVRGGMRAEDIPQMFTAAMSRAKERSPEVLQFLSEWTQPDIEAAIAGESFWITVNGRIRFTVRYSLDLGSIIVSDLQSATYDASELSLHVGASVTPYSNSPDDPGWHREGNWGPLDEMRWKAGGAWRLGGANAADRFGATTGLQCIAVYTPSVIQSSVSGYSACLVDGGWILVRPYTFNRPGMHAVAPDVMVTERLVNPVEALDAMLRLHKAMPYYYLEGPLTPRDWRPLSTGNTNLHLAELWRQLNGEQRQRLLGRRLYYENLSDEGQRSWRRTVPGFVDAANRRTGAPEPLYLHADDILGANLRFRASTHVRYEHFERGTGFSSGWPGFERYYSSRIPDDFSLHLYDIVEIWCTVALPSGKAFSERTEIKWYLGPATYGELRVLPPDDHPAAAIANKRRVD